MITECRTAAQAVVLLALLACASAAPDKYCMYVVHHLLLFYLKTPSIKA